MLSVSLENTSQYGKTQKLTVSFSRPHTRRERHGRGIGNTERGSGTELVPCDPGVPRQRFNNPGVFPAARDPGEEVLLLTSEAAHAGIGGGTAPDCARTLSAGGRERHYSQLPQWGFSKDDQDPAGRN